MLGLFVTYGLPLLGVGVGWLAKKLHVSSLIQEHKDVAMALRDHIAVLSQQVAKQEAVTPQQRRPPT